MVYFQNIWKQIRQRAPFILSLFVHALIILFLIHTTLYVHTTQNEAPDPAKIIFQDEGGKSDLLKYQDVSHKDLIKKTEQIQFPNPEINHFPVLPQIDFSPEQAPSEDLNIIRANTVTDPFFKPLPNRQPLYTGEEQLAGAFAERIRIMRRQGLDIAFVFDSTSSMGDFINYVKNEIAILVDTIKQLVPAARIGMVAYRDSGESFVTRTLKLTYGKNALHGFLWDLEPKGGGDIEEAVDEGLRVAIDDLNWKDDSVKVILLIGDAPPHKEDVEKCFRLIKKFRHTMGGTVATLDTNRPVLLTNQYAGCPPGVDIPCDYIVHEHLMEEFLHFAEAGGGECIRFIDKEKMNRMLVMNIFGSEWEEYLDVFLNTTEGSSVEPM